jgi:hypothetical protein
MLGGRVMVLVGVPPGSGAGWFGRSAVASPVVELGELLAGEAAGWTVAPWGWWGLVGWRSIRDLLTVLGHGHGGAVGCAEVEPSVGVVSPEVPAAFVDEVVVERAEQGQVVEQRRSVKVVLPEVVGFAPFGGGVAAGEGTAAVSFAEGLALLGGGVAEEVGDAGDLDGAVEGEPGGDGGESAGAQEAFDGGSGDGGAVGEAAASTGGVGGVGGVGDGDAGEGACVDVD